MKMQKDLIHRTASASEKAKEALMLSPIMVGSATYEGGHSGSSDLRRDYKLLKLVMPIFDGSNPDGWVMRAKRYFDLNRFNNEEKIEEAEIVCWRKLKERLEDEVERQSGMNNSLHQEILRLKEEIEGLNIEIPVQLFYFDHIILYIRDQKKEKI